MAHGNVVRALIGVLFAKAAVVGSWYLYQHYQDENKGKGKKEDKSAKPVTEKAATKVNVEIKEQKPATKTEAAVVAKPAAKKVVRKPAVKKAVKKVPTQEDQVVATKKVATKRAPRKTVAKKAD